MQKKNLIYIVGGAALIGYFLWMKKKGQAAAELPASEATPATPDQALAPSFVNQTTEAIKNVAKRIKSRKRTLKSSGAQQIDETSGMTPVSSENIMELSSPLTQAMSDMGIQKPTILSPKAAKQAVRASGGTGKQARQAAKAARKQRKMGELSVTF
jgi:hypothetical protein